MITSSFLTLDNATLKCVKFLRNFKKYQASSNMTLLKMINETCFFYDSFTF